MSQQKFKYTIKISKRGKMENMKSIVKFERTRNKASLRLSADERLNPKRPFGILQSSATLLCEIVTKEV